MPRVLGMQELAGHGDVKSGSLQKGRDLPHEQQGDGLTLLSA
jgi:hypothetical protein